VGRWLRAAHLDELPQLINVLRGEMRLVGPRPERHEIATQIELALLAYSGRSQVRPGITGLAQVQLPPDGDVTGAKSKLVYDLHYINDQSIWLDLRILFGTALKLLSFSFHTIRESLNLPIWSQNRTNLYA
jgi:lipopolysaccharide/colanic/teichoic acid biosynthesis glycosyltransferase